MANVDLVGNAPVNPLPNNPNNATEDNKPQFEEPLVHRNSQGGNYLSPSTWANV